MKYRLLVLDLDGTLTNERKEITPHTLETLLKVQDAGVKIVLASGRPTYGIVPLAKELEMDRRGGYILSFNGGTIIDTLTREVIYETTLPCELVAPLYEFSKSSDTTIITYKDEFIISEQPENRYVGHELFLTKMKPLKVVSFAESVDFAPDKCLIVGEPEKLIPLEKEIAAQYGERMNVFRSEPFFLELVPLGIDKALSLDRLLTHMGAKREEMIAVGDGFNDLTMIEFAGLGVAMANAQQKVKDAADFITLSNEEDGVAHVAERFIL